MRRLIVLPAALLILSSCAMKSDIPPEDVLSRSTQANRNVRSAAFDLDMLLHIPSTEGTIIIDTVLSGVMQNGGQQVQFDLETEGTTAAGTTWHALAQFVVADQDEVYVHVSEVEMNPPPTTFSPEQINALTGTWWKLPPSNTGSTTTNITPDPRMLRMQTEVIDVTRDRGIVSHNGARAHHYEIAVNNTKLAAFLSSLETSGSAVDSAILEAQMQGIALTGEIWIDADTYVLRRVEWEAQSPVPGAEPLMSMTADIHDHNSDITVSPPAEAQPLPIESLLQLPLPTY